MINQILETLEKQNIVAKYPKDIKNNIENLTQDFYENFYFCIEHDDTSLIFQFFIPVQEDSSEKKGLYKLDFKFHFDEVDEQEIELSDKKIELDRYTAINAQAFLIMYRKEISENDALLSAYSEQANLKNHPVNLKCSIKETTFNDYLQEVHKNTILPYLKKFKMEIDGQTYTLDKEHRRDIIKEYKDEFKLVLQSLLTGKIEKIETTTTDLENVIQINHQYSIVKSHHQMSKKLPEKVSKVSKAKL